MTTPERGDIVLVPFPFTDLTDTKRRPALVLSSVEYNEATGDVIIAQITSRVNAKPRPGDHLVAGWTEAGLLAPSLFRAKLTTLHSDLVERRLGRMPHRDAAAIDRALAGVLGF
jgi:mRNA interferase MazF